MKYLEEILPDGNSCIIHVDIDIDDAAFRPNLREKILSIDGVESVVLQKKYQLTVEKAQLFKWEEIISQITNILLRTFESSGSLKRVSESVFNLR